MSRKVIEGFVIVALVWLLSGCHAVNGLGQDLQDWTGPYAQHTTE